MENPVRNTIDPDTIRIDEIADKFESMWKLGQPPSIRDFIQNESMFDSSRLLIELLKVDLYYRAQANKDFPSFCAIVDQFPELIDAPGADFNSLIQCWHHLDKSNPNPHSTASGLAGQTGSDDHTPLETRPDPSFVGRFRIQRKLGAGAFGDVYLAHDPEMDRVVAIKLPRNRTYATSEEKTRFLAEARAVGSLRHPNIVANHEVGYHENAPFIVSDYIAGKTLQQSAKDHTYTFREIAEIISDIALAVEHAHRNQVIHRDIKPSNILLDQRGIPYLTDFGMARLDDMTVAITQDGKLLGTPCYMPPEQAGGKRLEMDHRVDVYSLGAVLYELLGRQRPFVGNTHAVLQQLRHDEPRPLTKLDDRIPVDLETICQKAMEKNPAHRYSTAAALAEDLQNYIHQRPLQARPLSRLARARRWATRNQLVAGLVFSVALLLMAATVTSSYFAVVYSNIADRERVANDQLEVQLSRTQLAEGIARLEQGDSLGLLQLLRATRFVQEQSTEFDSRKMLTAFWNASYERHLQQVVGHDAPLVDLAVSVDADVFATADNTGQIVVWSVRTGKPVAGPIRHAPHVASPARKIIFSSDGRNLVSFGGDGMIMLWNWQIDERVNTRIRYHCLPNTSPWLDEDRGIIFTSQDSELSQLTLPDLTIRKIRTFAKPVTTFGVSANHHRVVLSTSDGSVHSVNLKDGSLNTVERAHTDFVNTVAISPDGKWMASGSWDDRTRVWSLPDLTPVGEPVKHFEDVQAVAFSPDSRWLASASFDASVKIFDCLQARTSEPLTHAGPVFSVGFDPSSQQMVCGGYDGQLTVWDVSSRKVIEPRFQHQGGIVNAHFLSDGSAVVSAARDRTARVWKTGSAPGPKTNLALSSRCWSVDFSADNQQVVTASEDGLVTIWNVSDGTPVVRPAWHVDNGTMVCARWLDGNSQIIASNQHDLYLWSNRGEWHYDSRISVNQPIRKIECDRQGRFLICSSDIAVAWFVDLEADDARLVELNHPDVVTDVAISPDGQYLATSCRDGMARLFDRKTLERVGHDLVHNLRCDEVAFSPDGMLLATAAQDNSIQFWNVDDQTKHPLVIRPPWYVQDMEFHPNGLIIAVAMPSGDVQMYDLVAGQPCGSPLRHSLWVEDLDFSPNGKWMASACFDKSAQLWSIQNELFEPDLDRLQKQVWVTVGAQLDEAGILAPLDWKTWQSYSNEIR